MKEGDIVVCINSNGKKQLTIGKQYIINFICDDDDDIFEMGIIDDDDIISMALGEKPWHDFFETAWKKEWGNEEPQDISADGFEFLRK